MNEFDVLVADDEPVVIQAARRLLEPEGLTLDTAEDGEGVAARLRANSYRVILLDLMLPGVSGFELVESARKQQHGAPVIVVTGYASAQKAVAAFKAGAFDFLPKPFDTEELLGVVHRALADAGTSARRDETEKTPDGEWWCLGSHAWARLESDGSVRLGAAKTVSRVFAEIKSLDLPPVGAEIVQGGELARFSVADGSTHRVWSPLSGDVLEVNEGAESGGESWLIRVSPRDLERELKDLEPGPTQER